MHKVCWAQSSHSPTLAGIGSLSLCTEQGGRVGVSALRVSGMGRELTIDFDVHVTETRSRNLTLEGRREMGPCLRINRVFCFFKLGT